MHALKKLLSASRYALVAAPVVALLATAPALGDAVPSHQVALDVHKWQIVQRESGPTNYYWVVNDEDPFIRARYTPPTETAVLGIKLSDEDKRSTRALRWRWRAEALPKGGSECTSGKNDSAAVVYVTWKRGLRWYTLKYVWSAVDAPGRTCDSRRNPFLAQDTVVLESGGPLDNWVTEDIDVRAEFRKHFEGGNMNADVPELLGVGIMTDGDQTHSVSAADYSDFSLVLDR
jgi:hypothetical protein